MENIILLVLYYYFNMETTSQWHFPKTPKPFFQNWNILLFHNFEFHNFLETFILAYDHIVLSFSYIYI